MKDVIKKMKFKANGIVLHAPADLEKEFVQFKAVTGELYLQCIIQGYADTIGSDLKTLNPKEFKKREIIFREALNRFATSL